MRNDNDFAGIADASEPNAGRIYDYFLGGSHNFEVDRQAAENVLEVAPFMPELVRLIRWFMGEAVRQLCEQGFNKFLDFASGLPTVDHIHHIAPKGTKVIYSDIDPVTVAYAQDIIDDNPDVQYVHCEAEHPENLLNSGVVEEMFGDERYLAIGFNGIAWFLNDEDFNHSLSVLYEWSAPGSKLFFCDGDASAESEQMMKMKEIYKNVGQPIYSRPKRETLELIKPWEIDEPDLMPLEEWFQLDDEVSQKVMKAFGGGTFYGGILKK